MKTHIHLANYFRDNHGQHASFQLIEDATGRAVACADAHPSGILRDMVKSDKLDQKDYDEFISTVKGICSIIPLDYTR